MNRISGTGLDFIKGFESFVPYVYDDKVAARRVGGRLAYPEWLPGMVVRGTLTIGYGHTDSAKYDLGFALAHAPRDFRLTEAEAAEILDVDLDECEGFVNQMVKVPLTQGQFDALTSFCFNCGPGALNSLVARLNAGDYEACRKAFDLYVYSGKERMRGLQRRRDGEQDLWDANIPRVPVEPVDHPAEVDAVAAPPATMAQSSEGNVAVVTGTTGGGLMTDAAIDAATRVAAKGTSWDTLVLDFMLALLSSPQFWAGLVITVGSAYAWLRRRERLVTQGV